MNDASDYPEEQVFYQEICFQQERANLLYKFTHSPLPQETIDNLLALLDLCKTTSDLELAFGKVFKQLLSLKE